MTLISIGKIDKNIIPIIIACVFALLFKLLTKIDKIILFDHSIISNIYAALSKLLSFIPFIITKMRSKVVREKDNEGYINNTVDTVEYIYYKVSKGVTKGKLKLIFLASTLFFIQGMILFFTLKLKINIWLSEIFIYCLFYYLIFKIKPYKHHYVSIILIILTGITLDLVSGNLQNDILTKWPSILLRLLREILYSLQDVINKYIMEKKFCSVYELSFFEGIIYLILIGIFSIFNYFYFGIDDFEEYFKSFNYLELFVCIGFIIIQFGLEISSLFTVKNNTPCHLFIISVFSQLIVYFDDFSVNHVAIIICLIFILFMSLVYNEIIEINFFKLSENTKRNIMKRALMENMENCLNEDRNEFVSFDEDNEPNNCKTTFQLTGDSDDISQVYD